MSLDDFDDDDDFDEDDDPTEPCPHCGEPVYDDAERCPYCERHLSREDRPWSKPGWIVAGVLICLGVIGFPYLCYLLYLGLTR